MAQSYADYLGAWAAEDGHYVVDVVDGKVLADPSIPASDIARIQEFLDSNPKYAEHFGVYLISDLWSPHGPTLQYAGVTSPANTLEQSFVDKASEIAVAKGISIANAQMLIISNPTTYGFTVADIQTLESGYTARADSAVAYLGGVGWQASYSVGMTGEYPEPTPEEPTTAEPAPGEPTIPETTTPAKPVGPRTEPLLEARRLLSRLRVPPGRTPPRQRRVPAPPTRGRSATGGRR